jgi:ketosteroid isomerase-like protein
MRTLFLLILLAGVASAQDVLVAGGKSLADFRVEFRVSEIDRSSPMAFAKSWAALHAQEQIVARRFHDRFEQAHLAILDRFYDGKLIALQRKLYKEEVRDVNDLTCKLLEEKAGPSGRQLVYVRRRWIDAIDRPMEDRAQLMFRKEKDGKWRLVEVRYEIRPGVFERRDRTIPPVTARKQVPVKFPEMDATPAGVFKLLQLEFRKLEWERSNAQHELFRHYFSVADVLFGAEVAKELRANQPAAKPRNQFWYQEKEPTTNEDGSVLLVISALEKAPGQEAALVAGEAEFVMRKDAKGNWRVVTEALKTDPDKPAVPVRKKIGLFLMG